VVDLQVNKDIIEDVQLMIFDKDGTLMELYHYWSQMITMRAKLICKRLVLNKDHEDNLIYEMGVDKKNGKLRPEGPVGIKKREIVLQSAVDYLTTIGCNDAHDVCQKAFKEVDALSSTNLRQFIKPIKGSVELINALSEGKCKVAIATTDRSERAELAMGFLGFKDKIDLIVGADHVTKTKPDPEMVFRILDMLNISKNHAVMAGDALTDVQMGINAHLKASVAVLTGFATAEQCRAITPYIAESVAHITVIKKIWI